MKQKWFLWGLASLLLVSCGRENKKEQASQAGEMEKVISATVEEILAYPSEYQGKEVAVSGMVTHVCRHGGQKCFIVGEDGETQIRIEPGGGIDEFGIALEGSEVAFRGVFRVLNAQQSEEHLADHEAQPHHDHEMSHTEAEKADYYIEATEFRELVR